MDKKIKTVIASVLKPVDDTRMYEKLGISLQQTNRYDVNIIGFKTKNIPKHADIIFYPVFNFGRSSFLRLLAPFTFLLLLFKLKPALLIVTTFELLPPAIVYRLLYPNYKLFYDVQENYSLNVLSNRRGDVKSRILAYVIRLIERKSQKLVSLNLIAEINYTKEISFFSKNIILLNKYKPLYKINIEASKYSNSIDSASPILIFSGTISKDYGLWQSIRLVKELAEYFPNLKAKYVGQVENTKIIDTLLKIDKPYFSFQIDTRPIPHRIILKEISTADFGLVAHQPTMSIKNCFPTRIYELMHFRIPILLQDNPNWVNYCQNWDSCIPFDFNNFDIKAIVAQMKTGKFYKKGVPADIYWDSEEKKLIKATDQHFFVKH